jgi:hypothetical protein
MKINRIVLFKDGKAGLYCRRISGNMWEVINGAWDLKLDPQTLEGTIVKTGTRVSYDVVMEAPKGKDSQDYTDIMGKAQNLYDKQKGAVKSCVI